MKKGTKMFNKIFPESRRSSRLSENERLSLDWAYNKRPNMFIKRCRLAAGELKLLEPVVIINDFLPRQKDIPYNTKVKRSSQNNDNFHRAIRPIIIVGQVFGLFPICGITANDSSKIKFQWLSWRVFYSSIYLAAGFILVSLCVVRIFKFGLDIGNASMLVFYGSSFLTAVLFFRLSQQWPKLCRAIEKEESRSASYFSNNKRQTLVTKFRLCAFFILFSALVEHIMSILSKVASVYGCDKENPLVIGFYTSTYSQVFTVTGYAHWKAFFLQIFNFTATFIWNFMDLFIILMSVYLASRFDKLNQCIIAAKGRHLPEHFWKATRNEYANLAHLVGLIDENINELILLSFADNLYIICMQLFFGFNTAHDEKALVAPCWKKLLNGSFITMYLVTSFAFLIFRFLSVSMSASRIYSNSRVPLDTLFSVSAETYCVEVQRFIDHITSDIIAFTGMKFFHITKGLILTIAGTVVTYELVLVQFNAPPPSVQANITLKDNCGGIDSIKTGDYNK